MSITKNNNEPIIRREAKDDSKLIDPYQDIYYKRHIDPQKYKAYNDMIKTFSCDDKSAFDIYSKLEDARNKKSAWISNQWTPKEQCSIANIGFPAKCSPTFPPKTA